MNLIIETKNGKIRGIRKTSKLGDEFYAFQGVPYAKPPVGELRFKAPVPVEPWENVLDTIEEQSVPYYKMAGFTCPEPSEDCLYLNVYAKNLQTTKKPVIVFIYGGSFHSGSSSTNKCGPDFLMQKDVIFVTFNYRLSILGFLSFSDPAIEVPGNAAIKDQRLALKWVKENIDAFGGDSDNITVLGHSAGAGSLNFHLISPGSQFLFNRAVLMSGTAFSPWSICGAVNVGHRIAKNLGWDGNAGDRGAYEFLKKVDAKDLSKAAFDDNLLTMEEKRADVFHPFGPVIEPYESEGSLCTKAPIEMAKDCWSTNVDVIFWYVSNETLFAFDGMVQVFLKRGIDERLLVPYDIRRNMDPARIDKATRDIKTLYDFTDFGSHNYQPILDYLNDHWFHQGIHRGIFLRVPKSQGKTYLACFDIVSPTLNLTKIKCKAASQKGAAHGDELYYLFTNQSAKVPARDSNEFKNIQKMVELYVGFATEGSAYCAKMSWKPIVQEDLPYNYEALKIQDPVWSFGATEELSRRPIWDSLYVDDERFSFIRAQL